jgi:hypothetical protein
LNREKKGEMRISHGNGAEIEDEKRGFFENFS